MIDIDNKKVIKICALVPEMYDTAPSQRFRIEQWEPFLKQRDINIDYYPFSTPNLRQVIYKRGHTYTKVKELLKANLLRVKHILKAKDYDVVFLHRAASMVGPAWLERFLKLINRPIIYDFDDAIFIPHTSEANRLFSFFKFAGKTSSICRLSSAITVGNEWLADYALKYNENVSVIPSSVNTDIYQRKEKNTGEKTIIGWTGSSTSQTHLEMFASLLKRLIEKYPVEIHIHSDREPNLEDIPFIWHKWTPENEVEVISKFDIGIMPLPEDEWSKGKCSMKALLYMSLGIPAACSNIGTNREVIQNGANGFLADSEDDWLEKLGILISNEKLRLEMGQLARKTIIEKYSMEVCSELFAEVVMKTVNRQESTQKAAVSFL